MSRRNQNSTRVLDEIKHPYYYFFRRVVVVFVVVVVVVTPVYLRVSMSYAVYSFTSVKKMNAFTANA